MLGGGGRPESVPDTPTRISPSRQLLLIRINTLLNCINLIPYQILIPYQYIRA